MLRTVIGSPSAMPWDVPMGCPYCTTKLPAGMARVANRCPALTAPVITTSRASSSRTTSPGSTPRFTTATLSRTGSTITAWSDTGTMVLGMGLIKFYRTHVGGGGPSRPGRKRPGARPASVARQLSTPPPAGASGPGADAADVERTAHSSLSVSRDARVHEHGPRLDSSVEVVQV